MTFFPEIDRKKTKKQAVRKLNEYFRWCLVADTTGEQKVTASYTFEPRQAECSPSKPVERLAINRIAAQQELEAIRRAISNLFYPVHRKILTDKYIRGDKDWEIYLSLGYEKSQYYTIKDDALLAFAHSYRGGILVVEKSEK